MTMIMTHVSE